MLQNVATCEDFVNKYKGADKLLDCLHLPCVPYNFGGTPTSEALASMMRVLSEALPKDTLNTVLGHVNRSMKGSSPFWSDRTDGKEGGSFPDMAANAGQYCSGSPAASMLTRVCSAQATLRFPRATSVTSSPRRRSSRCWATSASRAATRTLARRRRSCPASSTATTPTSCSVSVTSRGRCCARISD